jgi:hypothetical protein
LLQPFTIGEAELADEINGALKSAVRYSSI